MSENNLHEERPEVYALRQDGDGWQISRRDFLKTAGISAAVVGVSVGSQFVRPAYAAEDLDSLCKDSLAHGNNITALMLSPDGKYLVSGESSGLVKCWDFQNYALLGSLDKSFSGKGPDFAGYVDHEPAVFSSSSLPISYMQLPLSDKSSSKTLAGNAGTVIAAVMDLDENIYYVSGKVIHIMRKEDGYKGDGMLVTMEQSVKSLSYLNGSKKLFIQTDKGFGILDPQSRELKTFDAACKYYAILPGESRALFCGSSAYSVVSLIDGREIWSRPYSDLGGSPSIAGAAVSPDGSIGILGTTGTKLWLISMADGSSLKEKSCGAASGDSLLMVMAKDGSKMAVAVGKSILFISLPDFEIIGCPVDLKEMKDTSKGIEVKGTDPVSGQTVTYTLPCGSPIPAGAVCVCNCVAGSIPTCSCDTYTCGCVGTCSCNNHTTTYSYSYHYWHPN